MVWTYNQNLLPTDPLTQLRLLVGDTLQKDPQFQDAELQFMLTQRSTIYGAAADACRALASQMSRQADSGDANLRTFYSSRARAYAASAARYEVQAMSRSGGLPYSGGISASDYDIMISDPDRISGQFNIGLTDNLRMGRLINEDNQVGDS